MTLMTVFLSDVFDCYALHVKADKEPRPTRVNLVCKIVMAMASIGYIIYDVLREDTPGPGTTAMVVLACLSEFGVWCFEAYTLYTTFNKWLWTLYIDTEA